MVTSKVRLDRVASSTRNARLGPEVLIGPEILSEEGRILAVRITSDKAVYNQVEDPTGRLIRLRSGDVLAGVLDVAGLAVDTVLRAYLEAPLAVLLDHFVHASRTIALCRFIEIRQVVVDRY